MTSQDITNIKNISNPLTSLSCTDKTTIFSGKSFNMRLLMLILFLHIFIFKGVAMFWYVYICCLLWTLPALAPFDTTMDSSDFSEKKTKSRNEQDRQRAKATMLFKDKEETPVRKNKPTDIETKSQTPTRTEFEDNLKLSFDARKKSSKSSDQSLDKAKRNLRDAKRSSVPLSDFVIPLRDTYNSTKSLTDIYSGQKLEDARTKFEQDLKQIDPYLYKKWRDSFFDEKSYRKKNRDTNNTARTDQEYFDYLNEHPDYLFDPYNAHEDTPIEIAINNSSPQMAQELIKIADNHNIPLARLVEPLVEQYKVTYQKQGHDQAYKYLESVYALEIPELSQAMHEEILKIR